MKSGILTILACPICKYYPLKLKIFKWETEVDKFKQLEKIIAEKKIESLRNDIQIKISKMENKIKIRDNISRSEKSFGSYIKELKAIYDDISAIKDDSNTYSYQILNIVKNELFNKINELKTEESVRNQEKNFEEIEFYIFLLNWYLFYAEIEDGIMICNQCKRWFPIIETIPQMLPDEVRKVKSDKKFLKKWKEEIEEKVLSDGKPYGLESEVVCPKCRHTFRTLEIEDIICPNCQFVFNQ